MRTWVMVAALLVGGALAGCVNTEKDLESAANGTNGTVGDGTNDTAMDPTNGTGTGGAVVEGNTTDDSILNATTGAPTLTT